MERNPTDERIDELADRVGRFEGRFERFEAKVDAKFDKVDERFEAVATKEDVARIDTRLDEWGKTVKAGVATIVVAVVLGILGVHP